MRDNLDAALAYAREGYSVFPIHSPMSGKKCDCHLGDNCTSPAKHPRTQHGLGDATTDVATVTRWWSTWRFANIAVATGPTSGIVVLDVDPRNGGDEELQRLVNENELLPAGPAYETGSGGSHYWFRHPGFKVTSRAMAGLSGLDVKGDGGYVIVPPSVHATGGSYLWYEDCAVTDALPEIAPWLMELMQRGDGGYGHTAEIPPDVLTNRNDTLASLGGTLRRRGLGEPAIFKLLMALNATWSKPLDAREVAKVAASVSRYEPVPEGEVIVDTGPGRARSARPPAPQEAYVPSTFTAPELMAMELPEVRWAVPELLPEGLALLAGKPKLGKSWMSFNIGLAVAVGGTVMSEYPVEDGDVLILALEDNKRRLQGRLRKMLGDEPPAARMHMETGWPREDQGGVEVLDSWLGLHPRTRFVVIDTLAKFRPRGGDSKYADDYAAMEGLQQLAGRHGVCILLITHYRKAFSDDWLDNVTGTLGIAGAADTILGLERPRGSTGMSEAVLHVTGRDVEEKDLALRWDMITAQWAVVGDAAAYRMSREMAEGVLVINKDGGVHTPAQWATILNKKRGATWIFLRRAVEHGLVEDYGSGLYGPLRGSPSTASTGTPVDGKLLRDSADIATVVDGKINENESKTQNAVDAVDGRSVDGEGGRLPSTASTGSGEKWPVREDGRPALPCEKCGNDGWTRRVSGQWKCPSCEPHLRVVGELAPDELEF